MPSDYQPWYTTQTYPSLAIPLMVNGVADDITGITQTGFSMILRTVNGVDTTGTGSFTVLANNPASVAYTFSNADVATAFTGEIVIKAIFPVGLIAVYDPIPFTVTAV